MISVFVNLCLYIERMDRRAEDAIDKTEHLYFPKLLKVKKRKLEFFR